MTTSMSTDAAVTEAFRSHAGLVERVLRRAGVAERDLNDLRQEVFIVVHRRLCEFEGRASLSTWLYRIALHVASDHRRRAYQRRERLAESEPTTDSPGGPSTPRPDDDGGGDPQAQLERRELLAHALRALAALDADKREAFVLAELYELPMREVAARLGCPQKTAFSRTYAARRRILAELQRVGALQLFPLFIPLRALRSLQLNGSVGALASTAVLPFAGAGVGAFVLAAGLVALLARDPTPRPIAAAPRAPTRLAAVAVPPVPSAAVRTAETAVVRSPPVRAQSLASAEAAAPPLPPAPAGVAPVAADEDDGMSVVRSGAIDVRPVLDNPLAPAAAASLPPPRIRVRGPSDAADGVEQALDSDPLFAYPIALD